ncbi:hypothetical protein EAH80_30315 [Mycobacterium hodleri]|uniref:Uncharacterized protein n=1 Tax=Mycolicibacterium hodleri TaxID=49897 RepID=A0A502DJ63_9MYCO|nr:hypothetical protein EAH80_30315 [Mycolicibacterium hodleri]
MIPVVNRLRRPVRVAVVGRAGVGRSSVETVLRQRGVHIAQSQAGVDPFDVCVLVIAETVKPEDLAVPRSSRRPVLIVLTKADLAGAGAGGPIAVARKRASAVAELAGVPVVPVVGLLATLGQGDLEHDLVEALRRFVTEPPNLTSVDAFVDDPHPVGGDVRARLLARLDRFGIAHAILALADGCDSARLGAHLAQIGNLDELVSALDAVTAPVRYRRVCEAIAELRSLAVQSNDSRLCGLLADDVTVLARMDAAVAVVEAAGLFVERGGTASAHLGRAVHWRRYGRGPVDALHRRCSADIVRGSLRLLAGMPRSST